MAVSEELTVEEHERVSPGSTEDADETDSTLGTDTSSITETLASSIMDYQFEHGRRYHAYEAGKYNMPNDEQEADRLDLQHQIWVLTLSDKLYRAPLDDDHIKNALDVGTGTGIWAIEFADQHPNCKIIGTDLSPIQPTWVPPNCNFFVDDAESERAWEFPPMDFIHSRFLTLGMKNWARYIERAFEALKPGGWIELQEHTLPLRCDDGSSSDEDPVMQWGRTMVEAGEKAGCDFAANTKFNDMLETTGFVNITKEEYKWPLGPWLEPDDERMQKLGLYLIHDSDETLTASCTGFFTRMLGWTKEEVDFFVVRCKASLRDAKKHRYMPITVHYAQKPTEGS